MPQFDKILFFNQIFWLVSLFFVFYSLLTYFFLPRVCYLLKIRNKKRFVVAGNNVVTDTGFSSNVDFCMRSRVVKLLDTGFVVLYKTKA